MTTPSDPWGQRPGSSDAPTEYLGASGGSEGTRAQEYSDAYGSTEPYRYFDQAPGPNPTRELPPYQSQWGVYEGPGPGEAAYDTQWVGPNRTMPIQGGPPPTLIGPPGLPQDQPPDLPPHRNRRGMWVGLTLVAFAVVVLGGIAAGLFLGGTSSTSSTAEGSTYRSAPTQLPMFPQEPDSPGTGTTTAPQLPGLGTVDGLGATMGTISANDGSTLTVDSLSGSTITVHTDAKTEVIALGSSTVADLHPGDMVVVQGDKNADGSIQAKIVIGTALPSQGTTTPTPTR